MGKKLLFVIPYLYAGGAQSLLYNIESHFPDAWEIETLVNSEYKKAYELKGKIHSLGIDETPRTASVSFQFGVFVKRIKKLRELKKTGGYVACISLVDSANIANILSGGRWCKTVISVVTSLGEISRLPQYRFIVNPLARLFYNKADKVIAVSEELKSELIRDYGISDSKIVAIPLGCDMHSIERSKLERLEESVNKRLKEKKIICNVGRLSYPKGQWHLIRAFKHVLEVVPDSMLIIVGDGEKREYLESVIDQLTITDNVLLLGRVDSVYKYINVSDAFVFPSLLEGFPNALAEALCVGVPCIAADFRTGARELLAPERLFDSDTIVNVTECEYGILTPRCSGIEYKGNEPLEEAEEELAKAMIMMITDSDINRKYREKSDIRARDLDIYRMVEKWVKVVENEECTE